MEEHGRVPAQASEDLVGKPAREPSLIGQIEALQHGG
jgi:hypothetical protein